MILQPEYRPVFVYDRDETYPFPVPVVPALNATGCRVPESFPGTTAPLHLRTDGVTDRLDFPPNVKQPDLPPTVYHRAVTRAGMLHHQLWLFYVGNPKAWLGTGAHEGDWELVQISTPQCGGAPVFVTMSRHHHAFCIPYFSPRLQRDGKRPVIYVARDSHAHYITPLRNVPPHEDVCDGRGNRLAVYDVTPFSGARTPWQAWDGWWGNSTGPGKSPQSPARQGRRWNSPDLLIDDALAH